MVANSRKLTRNLQAYIRTHVTMSSCYELSDTKRDGTVFVRFRSSEETDSDTLSSLFSFALLNDNKFFSQVDDRTFRVPLNQFGG